MERMEISLFALFPENKQWKIFFLWWNHRHTHNSAFYNWMTSRILENHDSFLESSWQIMLFCNGRYHRSLFEYFAWCLYVCLLIPSQQCKMQSRKICSSDQAQIWVWSSYQHSRYCMCHGFGYLVSHFLFYFVDYILIMCYFPPDVI